MLTLRKDALKVEGKENGASSIQERSGKEESRGSGWSSASFCHNGQCVLDAPPSDEEE